MRQKDSKTLDGTVGGMSIQEIVTPVGRSTQIRAVKTSCRKTEQQYKVTRP